MNRGREEKKTRRRKLLKVVPEVEHDRAQSSMMMAMNVYFFIFSPSIFISL